MINDPTKKMQMTQVLQDPMTGQLIFKKQEIQSQVFRPSWKQPTMSLDELAEKEIKEAMEREARQKVSEENAKNAPRRYEYLVRDGMEDNADLVDASAKLDREWDDWKDENPRGSGNKMGDRGDRNF
jgi:immunoglobulin-binding protein 1